MPYFDFEASKISLPPASFASAVFGFPVVAELSDVLRLLVFLPRSGLFPSSPYPVAKDLLVLYMPIKLLYC